MIYVIPRFAGHKFTIDGRHNIVNSPALAEPCQKSRGKK
jgi:hypothetical protein